MHHDGYLEIEELPMAIEHKKARRRIRINKRSSALKIIESQHH